MEFNMHFLGIKTAEGIEDSTLFLVQDFIKTLAPSRKARRLVGNDRIPLTAGIGN
jgi:hypothetical protein